MAVRNGAGGVIVAVDEVQPALKNRSAVSVIEISKRREYFFDMQKIRMAPDLVSWGAGEWVLAGSSELKRHSIII